jgi:nucleotide-binding universal stress UspA family protein
MGTIVLGYVRRAEGMAALEQAIEEARRRDGHLVILHSMRGGERDEVEDVVQYREDFEEIEKELTRLGIDHTLREYVRGRSVAEDVLAVAEEEDAELIVLGIRRRSPVGKLLLGSNAQSILLNAPCPVLAVPSRDEHGS